MSPGVIPDWLGAVIGQGPLPRPKRKWPKIIISYVYSIFFQYFCFNFLTKKNSFVLFIYFLRNMCKRVCVCVYILFYF